MDLNPWINPYRWGQVLATRHGTQPYISVYDREGCAITRAPMYNSTKYFSQTLEILFRIWRQIIDAQYSISPDGLNRGNTQCCSSIQCIINCPNAVFVCIVGVVSGSHIVRAYQLFKSLHRIIIITLCVDDRCQTILYIYLNATT